MTELRVFYPMGFGSTGAIATVYQNIAQHSKMKSVAFEVQNPSVSLDNVETIPIPDSRVEQIRIFIEECTKADVVHTGPRLPHSAAALLKHITDVEMVHTVHTAEVASLRAKPGLRLNEILLRNTATRITAISEFVALSVIEHTPFVESSKIEIVPNGVNMATFYPERSKTEPERILYIGRNAKRKNPGFVLELAKKHPELQFRVRITGLSDPLNERLLAVQNVTVLPHLSEEELALEYSKSSVTICPFQREGFGLVVVESLATGTPVVGLSDANLIRLLSESPGGYLCDSLTTAEWIPEIERAMANQDEAQIRSSVRKYRWEAVVNQFDELYKALNSD